MFRKTLLALIALFLPMLAQSTRDADGTTPLHWAVRSDDIRTVQRLLQAGANPSASNRYGITPLSIAAMNGNATMTGLLLKAGANPKADLPGGQSLLMTAARTGTPDVV